MYFTNLKQRLLDDDNGGTIGFPEIQKTLDLCNAKVFPTQTSLSGGEGGRGVGGILPPHQVNILMVDFLLFLPIFSAKMKK